MKVTMKNSMVLAMILSVIGVVTIFAIPAMTSSGTGCFVRNGPGPGDYVVDDACKFHQVVKLDANGDVEFFTYQDKGQVQGDWRPDRTMRTESFVCYTIAPYGQVCGNTTETVTPSGEYKSSFKSR